MSKDPTKVRQGRSSKRAGADFETRVRKYLLKFGWYVQRNTFGLYDIVAIPPTDAEKCKDDEFLYAHAVNGDVLMLQPTRSKYPPRDKKLNLIKNAHKWLGVPYLVQPDVTKYRHPLVFTKTTELKIR